MARAIRRTGSASCRGLTDKTLRFWDAATGAAIGAPLRHEDRVIGAVYSPGRAAHPVVVAGQDAAGFGTRRRWGVDLASRCGMGLESKRRGLFAGRAAHPVVV